MIFHREEQASVLVVQRCIEIDGSPAVMPPHLLGDSGRSRHSPGRWFPRDSKSTPEFSLPGTWFAVRDNSCSLLYSKISLSSESEIDGSVFLLGG